MDKTPPTLSVIEPSPDANPPATAVIEEVTLDMLLVTEETVAPRPSKTLIL